MTKAIGIDKDASGKNLTGDQTIDGVMCVSFHKDGKQIKGQISIGSWSPSLFRW